MIGVAIGLIAGTMIGASDCVARVTARRTAPIALAAVIFGLGALALAAWCAMFDDWPGASPIGWRDAIVAGVLNVAALGLYYAALARGPVALAAPAASSFSVILVVLNALAGEPFAWPQIAAAVVVFLGVAQLSRSERPRRDRPLARAMEDPASLRLTLLLAIGAALSLATRLFLAQDASAELGIAGSLLISRLSSLATALSIVTLLATSRVLASRKALAFGEHARADRRRLVPPRELLGLVLLQSFLETASLCVFLLAGEHGGRIGAVIGFTVFAAVTPIVAWLWLGDSLSRRRAVWIFVVIAGVSAAAWLAPR